MKKRNGFTLTELIAVIVILIIIILIAIPIYSGIRSRMDAKDQENRVKLIEVAAAKFSEDTGITHARLKDLVHLGYIDEEVVKGLIPTKNTKPGGQTTKKAECLIAESVADGQTYVAKILMGDEDLNIPCISEESDNEEVPSEPDLDLYFGNAYIEVKQVGQTETFDVAKWSNQDLELKAIAKEGLIESVQWYSGISGGSVLSTGTEYTVQSDTSLKRTYRAVITIKNSDNKTTTVTAIKRVKIDKVSPKFYQKDIINYNNIINNSWKKDYTYKPQTYDNESGVYGYYFEENGEQCATTRTKYKYNKNTNKQKYYINHNGTYRTCVMDNAGNITDSNVALTHIDPTNLSCEIVLEGTAGSNGWYKGTSLNVRLKSNVTAGPSGLKLALKTGNSVVASNTFAPSTANASVVKTINTNANGIVYEGTINNEVGPPATCKKTVYYENNTTLPIPSYDTALTGLDKISINPSMYNGYCTGSNCPTPPPSGIASWKVYYCEGSNCNPTQSRACTAASNKLSASCTIPVTAKESDHDYIIKDCYVTNSGIEVCDTPRKIPVPGWCSSKALKDTSECSDTCGGGKKKRMYYSTFSGYTNKVCGTYYDYNGSACNTHSCCASMSGWSGWNTNECNGCGNKNKYRYRYSAYAGHTGTICATDTQSCGLPSCSTPIGMAGYFIQQATDCGGSSGSRVAFCCNTGGALQFSNAFNANAGQTISYDIDYWLSQDTPHSTWLEVGITTENISADPYSGFFIIGNWHWNCEDSNRYGVCNIHRPPGVSGTQKQTGTITVASGGTYYFYVKSKIGANTPEEAYGNRVVTINSVTLQ